MKCDSCDEPSKYTVEGVDGEGLLHQCETHHNNSYTPRLFTNSERGTMLDWYSSGTRYGTDTFESAEGRYKAKHREGESF